MSLGSAYVSGLISGMDTASLVSQLLAIERRPIDLMMNQVSLIEQRKSAYQKLNTALLDFKTKAAELARSYTFDAVTATSSDESVLTAVATGSVPVGTYSITVNQAATRSVVGSNSYAGPDDPITNRRNRRIDISLGGTQVLRVDVERTDTLNTLADKINAANAGVSAFVMNEGTGYRLIIQSQDTGTANEVTVDTNVPGLSFTTITQAQDAEIEFGETNPVTITSSSNTFQDVIPGLTLTVQQQPSTPTQVTVEVIRDEGEIRGLIEEFIAAYNNVVDTIAKYNTYSEGTGQGGPLFNEMPVRLLQSDLTAILSSVVSAAPEAVNSLAALGVTIDREGKIELSEEDLTAALEANFEGVRTLFSDAAEGVAIQFRDRLDYLTRPGDGLIHNVTTSLDEQITYYEGRIDDMEEMLALREDTMRRQFVAMEEALAALQAQSQYLSMHLGNVNSLMALMGG